MKVSVVIPTHNRQEQIWQTVRFLCQQTFPPCDYEIIIVDDGSSPPIKLSNNIQGPLCRLVRLEGLERSAARNAGAEAAQGELLVFIDDDIQVKYDFVESHWRSQREWGGLLIVGAILLPDETRQAPFGRFRHQLEQGEVPLVRGIVPMRNFCAAGNMSIPRNIFQKLAGFDLGIASSEDQDLALRHTASGGKIAFLPEAEAIHCDSALDIRSYCRRNEWGMAQMFPFMQRYPNWPDNVERARVNGPIRWGREPFSLSGRKAIKSVLASSPIVQALFLLTSVVERMAPSGAILDKLYRLLLGLHIFRGYRKGLNIYAGVAKGANSMGTPATVSDTIK